MDLQTIILISILSMWMIYQIIVLIFAKKKEIYNLIILIAFGGVFGFFYLTNKETENEYLYTFYFLILYLLASFIIQALMAKFRRKISEKDYDSMEETIEEINLSSELLRNRFISTIEILYEGISFRDTDGLIFGSDKYIKYLGIKSNNFDVYEFEEKVHKDDLNLYKTTLEKTTNKKPVYNINFRIKNKGKIIWIKEVGKRIVVEKKVTYISVIKPLDIRLYPETEIDVLNGLYNYKKMYEEMQEITRNKLPYNLIVIKLTNIPNINEKYGRDIGDLMMGKYLSKIQFRFLKESNSLFRIDGIKFGFIIREKFKFDILERGLQGTGEMVNMEMEFGGVKQKLFPKVGLSESPYEGKTAEIVFQEANEALNNTFKESATQSYCFYNRK